MSPTEEGGSPVPRTIQVAGLPIANHLPLVLMAGLNVLESRALALEVAGSLRDLCRQLGVSFIFKASFDKANRSSLSSFRGPGLETGLTWLKDIKDTLGVPILTDVHAPEQAVPAAEVADILQLPAFLSRQTDLVLAMAATGRPVQIKKAQFLAPREMVHILEKFQSAGNGQLILCERGTMFGYNNLVVDMLGFEIMKAYGYPVVFDVTHSLQLPGGRPNAAGGRRQHAAALARSGVAQGIAGLFVEVHPNPDQALCDGPSALPLAQLPAFLHQVLTIDACTKQLLYPAAIP